MGNDSTTDRIAKVLTSHKRQLAANKMVAAYLRDMILSGELGVGERLPGELELGELFQVGRSTVREAIKVLESERLVEISRGAGGGTFVSMPQFDDLEESLGTLLTIMVREEGITIDELIEIREILEVRAVEIAATKRLKDSIDAMKASLPDPGTEDRLTVKEFFASTGSFHLALLSGTGNRALAAFGRPIYSALHRRAVRETAGIGVWRHVLDDHRRFIELIEAGDAKAAADLMRQHLVGAKPIYQYLSSEEEEKESKEEE